MRVLIVDDEAPARARLRQLLAAHPDCEIVAEAESGPQAMEQIAAHRPDVVLLDIQMPGCSGIDVAACLPKPRPHIIFCTAHDQHAVDAFELQALDYLLKPVSRTRLAAALDRVKGCAPDRAAALPAGSPARFLVRQGERYLVVGEARVLYFASTGGLTQLVAADARYWMDPTLNDLERRVEAARFFRISRAALVNLQFVAEVLPLPGGSGEILLKNGDRLEVSRRRFRELMAALSGR